MNKNRLYAIATAICLMATICFAVGCFNKKQTVKQPTETTNYEFVVKAIDPGFEHQGRSAFDAVVTLKNPEQKFSGTVYFFYEHKTKDGEIKPTMSVPLSQLGVVSSITQNHFGNRIPLPPEDIWFRGVVKTLDGKPYYSDFVKIPVNPDWAKAQK